MTDRKTNRWRLAGYSLLVILAFLILTMPATQTVLACALDKFMEIADRALHFPCTLLEHGKCFILDRLDPTCPQCL